MRKILYLLLFLSGSVSAQSSFKILFVDDSGDAFGNGESLVAQLDSLGYTPVYFDAYGQGVSPTLNDMNDYDLVIWYTSTWGAGLQLWNGNDSDNPELLAYLAQPTANLWLIGLDYFYDRYGAAPASFLTGEFPYDYLGISKYAVQSYADDGSLGLPQVTPETGQPITGLGVLNWQFTTLWYADGFELRPQAKSIYNFGDAGYVLSGYPTGVLYRPASEAHVLTYGFDLALANNPLMIRSHFETVLNWWKSELSAAPALPADWEAVQFSPNAFSDYLDVRVKTNRPLSLHLDLYNAAGQRVAQFPGQPTVLPGVEQTWHWSLPAGLPNGAYYGRLQSERQTYTVKLLKSAGRP